MLCLGCEGLLQEGLIPMPSPCKWRGRPTQNSCLCLCSLPSYWEKPRMGMPHGVYFCPVSHW